jgi:Holliday junction resolvase
MSNKSKGKRNERELAELYEEAGYRTFRPQESKWGETDMFNLFDLLAIHPTEPVHMVQAKTNGARGIEQWVSEVSEFQTDHCRPLYAVRYDREGWRILERDNELGGYTTVLDAREREENIGTPVVEYLQQDPEAIE